MKIGFYNPYFDSLGGGERYSLTLAAHWSQKHEVVLFWDDPRFLIKAQERFGLNLSQAKTVPNFFSSGNLLKKIFLSQQYDLIFFLSDGSIPTTLAKRNILHFQVPFAAIPVGRLKLSRFQAVICNSQFTLRHLDQYLQSKARVIYPPVSAIETKNQKKEKIILSVGRFTSYFQAKKQEVLIEAFKAACSAPEFAGWRLILAGGLLPSDQNYFLSLQKKSEGMPVELLPNISYEQLVSLYQAATFYWHAAGFAETDPQLMEHFGIATVEAMSAGSVPLVFNGGGQPEIVRQGQDGFLWQTKGEL
ncbi:MAG: glycosyltransferase family 4 protein, partial [Patescibacteria group bacterium]